MRNKTDLATAALQQGSLIAADESLTAVDLATVAMSYDTKLAEWRRRGYVWWTNTDNTTNEIPNEVFGPLTLLLYNEIRSAFGQANDPVTQQRTENELLKGLRRVNTKQPSGESTRFSSY
jgi:ABC-type Mn2+/Zn2+ transport system ATPase subunit